jgi:hypothetical protein
MQRSAEVLRGDAREMGLWRGKKQHQRDPVKIICKDDYGHCVTRYVRHGTLSTLKPKEAGGKRKAQREHCQRQCPWSLRRTVYVTGWVEVENTLAVQNDRYKGRKA